MSHESHLPPFSRREMLARSGMGLAGLSLAGLLADNAAAASNPMLPKAPHFAPRAKRVIHLFMNGGPNGNFLWHIERLRWWNLD